ALRQVKLRGSRTIGFAGLLLLVVQAAAREDDALDWIAEELGRTPLERVTDAMRRCDIDAGNLLEAYAAVHGTLCDPTARQVLAGDPGTSHAAGLLLAIRDHGQTIRGELLRVFNALTASAGSKAAMDVLF
ncbi:MAG: hypothetical protein KJO38_01570, partial [Gammaproteobacteria bacterium]|nr:hypothetical protein [Gammaproteobacteria bacterium]